jgi:hypothetical protein
MKKNIRNNKTDIKRNKKIIKKNKINKTNKQSNEQTNSFLTYTPVDYRLKPVVYFQIPFLS